MFYECNINGKARQNLYIMMATNIFIHPSRIIHSLFYKLCTIFVKFLFRVLTTPPSFKQLWVSIFANSTTLEKTSWTFKAAKFQLVTIPSSISCAYIYLYILSKKTVLIKATMIKILVPEGV